MLGLTTLGLPQAAYSSSKAAVIGLTPRPRQPVDESQGIRVNALAPGYFASEMSDRVDDDYMERIVAKTEMKRMGRPEELAAALLFLVSDAGGYVTGQTVPVDGGLLVGR